MRPDNESKRKRPPPGALPIFRLLRSLANRWLRRVRWLRAVDAFIAHLHGPAYAAVATGRLRVERNAPLDVPANAGPYVRLARYWEAFHTGDGRGYPAFLSAAGRWFGCPTAEVLDLACGTGRVARKLAESGRCVVGLDVSQAMLLEAEVLRGDLDIRYELGDFRRFELGGCRFDVALCVGDSLNYLAAPGELDQVFRCVAQHLRPGGLFLMDSLGDAYLCLSDGTVARREIDQQEVVVRLRYDPEMRVSEDRVIVGDVVERHRRVPIGRADIASAARSAGLEFLEDFNEYDAIHGPACGGRLFTFLRKPVT